MQGIEEGDGLPDIATCNEVVEALKEAGFEIVEAYDAYDLLVLAHPIVLLSLTMM